MAAERLAQLRVRGKRIEVPDALRPKGIMTAPAAVAALGASRAALLDAARAADPVALEHRTYHHAVIGRLTLRDCRRSWRITRPATRHRSTRSPPRSSGSGRESYLAGESPCRRITSAMAARSGGPPAAFATSATSSRK